LELVCLTTYRLPLEISNRQRVKMFKFQSLKGSTANQYARVRKRGVEREGVGRGENARGVEKLKN